MCSIPKDVSPFPTCSYSIPKSLRPHLYTRSAVLFPFQRHIPISLFQAFISPFKSYQKQKRTVPIPTIFQDTFLFLYFKLLSRHLKVSASPSLKKTVPIPKDIPISLFQALSAPLKSRYQPILHSKEQFPFQKTFPFLFPKLSSRHSKDISQSFAQKNSAHSGRSKAKCSAAGLFLDAAAAHH